MSGPADAGGAGMRRNPDPTIEQLTADVESAHRKIVELTFANDRLLKVNAACVETIHAQVLLLGESNRTTAAQAATIAELRRR